MPGLSAVFDQQPPFQHDVLRDLQNAQFKHRPNLVGQPIAEFCAVVRVRDEFNAESYFRQRDRTDIQVLEWLRCDKRDDPTLRFTATELGENIGVE